VFTFADLFLPAMWSFFFFISKTSPRLVVFVSRYMTLPLLQFLIPGRFRFSSSLPHRCSNLPRRGAVLPLAILLARSTALIPLGRVPNLLQITRGTSRWFHLMLRRLSHHFVSSGTLGFTASDCPQIPKLFDLFYPGFRALRVS